MRRFLALVPAALVVLAGCGPQAVSGAPSGSGPGNSTTPSATTTSATTAARPSAADGSDLAACADGTCEVEVRADDKIPLSAPVGINLLTVESLSAEGVTVVGTAPGISLTFGSRVAGRSSTLNKLFVTIVAIGEDSAVLRLAPRS